MLPYFVLAVCAAAAVRLVIRYDLYDREPWHMLALVVLAGAGVMALAGGVEDRLIQSLGGGQPTAVLIAGVAATVEELGRFVVVLAVAVLVPKYFNDPMDGLIYGSVAGIGMALEETTLTLTRAAGLPILPVLPAEFVRLFGHIIMGGITGFGIGTLRRHGRGHGWIAIAAGCMVAGVTIHFLWDLVALAAMDPGGDAWVPASIGLMVTSMGLYGVLVVQGSRWSRAMFAPHSPERVWGRRRSS